MCTLRRLAFVCVAALAVPATTYAQPAAAVGHPLPDGKLGAGTITVKVVDGSPSKPVVGTDVTLLVNGQPRQARTDETGRATFSGLPADAKVQAKVVDANQKEQTSDEFPVPSDTGVRVMLSISPFQGMGGAPMASGQGMPSARDMSGQPRPDRAEAPGNYVARLTYNNLKLDNGQMSDDAPPAGSPVFLVAYGADDTVKVQTQQVGADGLATFTGLDVSGATAYYSLASLARTGAVDRLIATGTVLDGSGGARVVLSGEKRDATDPGVDDYSKLIPRDPRPVPGGQVRISLDGVAPANNPVSIVDARTGAVVATVNATPGAADASQVTGRVDFADDPALALGKFAVEVRGGAGNAQEPLAGIEIRIVNDKADDTLPNAQGSAAVATTDATGTVLLDLDPEALKAVGNIVRAQVTINGKTMSTDTIDLRTQKRLAVFANWPTIGKPEATIAVAPTPGQVLYAETSMAGQKFRSLPFLNLAETGMHVNIYVFPRTLFRFDTVAYVEDQLLAFQGDMQVTNYSWAPYRAGNDGLVIQLPAGFKGAGVAGADQEEVAVAEKEGLRILRPIPPGGRTFRMGYSMPIDGGNVDWAFKLPMGTYKSSLKIRQTPSMTIKLPDGIRGETRNASTGEPWFVIDDITLDRNKTFAVHFGGFPAPPSWKVWAPRFAGMFVILLIGGGIAFAFTRRRDLVAERQERRDQLLDDLVELERKGGGEKRKDQLLAELEQLWTK